MTPASMHVVLRTVLNDDVDNPDEYLRLVNARSEPEQDVNIEWEHTLTIINLQ